MDDLVEILYDANISRKRKIKTNFVLNKDDINFKHVGKFGLSEKFVALPTHFSFKEDKEFDEFIEKLKMKYEKVDFSNVKDLLRLTPKELEFAIFFELDRTAYDLKVIDSAMIFLFGALSINMVGRVKNPMSSLSLATLIFIAFIGVFFSYKKKLLEEYAINKIMRTNNLELIENGLKYFNKKIQLDQLLGKDVKNLKENFKALEEKCKFLKETDLSVDKNVDEIDEKRDNVIEYMKNLKKESGATI